MHTPTHVAFNFLALGRKPESARGWIVAGAILPDVPMFGFFFYEKLFRGESAERIFRELYFDNRWQTLFNVFHSIPLFCAMAIGFWWFRNREGLAFATSLLLHALVDWPTHLEDAHAYLWPFVRTRLPGFISYWHRGSLMWTIEMGLIVAALAWWLAERAFGSRRSRERVAAPRPS